MTIKISKFQNYKNIATNIMAFVIQFLINFYIAPIMVMKLGAASYGFIGIANDFVAYISIIATIFNSVSARFIANSFYQKDYEKANGYFNSLIVVNIIISIILAIISIVLCFNLENILVIPADILFDVQLTFFLIFLSYILSLLTLVFTTSTYVTNRTDIQGLRNITNNVIRFILIIILLNCVSVRICWIAVSTLIATLIISFMNVHLTRQLTPELSVDFKLANVSYALELAKSGSWMVLISTSTILMRGLDLYIANNWLGSYEMGLLSIARTMPNNVTSVINTIGTLFTPMLIALYIHGNRVDLINSIKESIDTIVMIMFVPLAGFIVFSFDFYRLWQNGLLESEIYIITTLSSITILQAFFNTATVVLGQISVVTNMLRMPVLVNFGCGILNIVIVFILLQTTTLGLYAIVIPSTIIMIVRYVFFNNYYAAYLLNQSKHTFFKTTFFAWVTIPILTITIMVYRYYFPIHSWKDLFIAVCICGAIGYIEILLLYKVKKKLGKANCKLI